MELAATAFANKVWKAVSGSPYLAEQECIECHGRVEPQKKGTCELASRISKMPNPSIAARPFVTSALGEKAPAQALSPQQMLRREGHLLGRQVS